MGYIQSRSKLGTVSLFLFVFFIVGLHASIVFSATEDFQYAAPNFVETCACSSFVIEGLLHNTGNTISHYEITHKGIPREWVHALPTRFWLRPNEERRLHTFVSVPCDAEGEYVLETRPQTIFDLEKVHQTVFNVQRCAAVNLQVTGMRNRVCAGDVAVYNFQLSNRGPYYEIIVPSVRGFDEMYVDFDQASYMLAPGDTVTAYMYIAGDDLFGMVSGEAVFSGQRSGFSYISSFTYDGVDCLGTESVSEVSFFALSDLILLFLLLLVILFLLLLFLVVRRLKRIRNSPDNIALREQQRKERAEARARKEILAADLQRQKDEQQKRDDLEKEKSRSSRTVVAKKALSQKTESKKPISAKEKQERKKRKKRVAAILLLILLLLLLLGFAFGSLVTGYRPALDVSSVFGFDRLFTGTNETIVDANVTDHNITDHNITGVTVPPINDTVAIEDNETALINDSLVDDIDYNVTTFPSFSTFFTFGFGTFCGVLINVFLVLFILSLFLYKITPRKTWSAQKQSGFIVGRHALIILLFLCLVTVFTFCVYTSFHSGGTWPGACSVVTVPLDLLNETNASAVNITDIPNTEILQESDDVHVDTRSLPLCFCHVFLGGILGELTCLWILLLLLLVFLIVVLLGFLWPSFTSWVRNKREERRKRKIARERARRLSLAREEQQKKQTAVIAPQRTLKKEKSSDTSKDSPKKSSSLWKDILLLLLLVLLLFVVGYYFTVYAPLSSFSRDLVTDDNETTINVTDEEQELDPELEIVVEDTVVSEIDEQVLHPFTQNLKCEVGLASLREGILIRLESGETVFSDELIEGSVTYSWYLDREGEGDFIQVYENQTEGVIDRNLIQLGDVWVCGVTLRTENHVLYEASAPYFVVTEDVANGVDEYNDSISEIKGEIHVDENVVAVFAMLEYIEENNLTRLFEYFVMESGTTDEIVLSNHFIDPDGDELFFNVVNITNETLQFSVWRDILTIRAPAGFVGIVNATVVAEDPHGESVSAPLTVVVKPREGSTLWIWWSDYANAVMLFLLGVLLIIGIFLLYRSMTQEQPIDDSDEESEKESFFKK